jgi:hypothetical protein
MTGAKKQGVLLGGKRYRHVGGNFYEEIKEEVSTGGAVAKKSVDPFKPLPGLEGGMKSAMYRLNVANLLVASWSEPNQIKYFKKRCQQAHAAFEAYKPEATVCKSLNELQKAMDEVKDVGDDYADLDQKSSLVIDAWDAHTEECNIVTDDE